jgi:hypothetical protein
VAEAMRKMAGAIDIPSWLRHTRCRADLHLLLRHYRSLVRARIEYGSFLIHGLYNSQNVLIKNIHLKALKRVLGLRSSTPANVLGKARVPPLYRDLAHNFIMRMLTNEAHALHNTLEEIIDWMENPVNIVRVDMVPLMEAFRGIIPKEHLIGKALLPLCSETAIMSRPSVGIDRGMKLAASSEPTPLLFGNFYKEELKQARSLFTDGPKSAEGPFGGIWS